VHRRLLNAWVIRSEHSSGIFLKNVLGLQNRRKSIGNNEDNSMWNGYVRK
jgi:hypothetical protein